MRVRRIKWRRRYDVFRLFQRLFLRELVERFMRFFVHNIIHTCLRESGFAPSVFADLDKGRVVSNPFRTEDPMAAEGFRGCPTGIIFSQCFRISTGPQKKDDGYRFIHAYLFESVFPPSPVLLSPFLSLSACCPPPEKTLILFPTPSAVPA